MASQGCPMTRPSRAVSMNSRVIVVSWLISRTRLIWPIARLLGCVLVPGCGGGSARPAPGGRRARRAVPASLLEAAVTVGVGGVVREIAVSWATWKYTVTYSGLDATAAPKA